MEDYLCRNDEISPAPGFKYVHWDITLVKDPGGYLEAEVLTFQKDAKSIFSKDNATLSMFDNRTLDLLLAQGLSKTPNSSRLLKKAVALRLTAAEAT
ncbi:DUF11 domain-containing protein [Sesbania bispinosa]|nr:DUF11 domain-containing protein [Sesbania bispinosa]